MDTPDKRLELAPTTAPEPDAPEPGVLEPGPRGSTLAATAAPFAPHRRGPRMRTIVLGLVLLAASATSLLRLLTDVQVDNSAVALTVLLVAGALLLGGGVLGAAREARSPHS